MRIDDQVETLARSALDAAVKRDFDRLESALQAFPDDDVARRAVELALAVCTFVLVDVHQGKPDGEQIKVVAGKIAEMERWAEPTTEEIHTLLSGLFDRTSQVGVMPTESVVVLSFVVAASLLASLHLKDEEWWNYLDRAEAAIEKAG